MRPAVCRHSFDLICLLVFADGRSPAKSGIADKRKYLALPATVSIEERGRDSRPKPGPQIQEVTAEPATLPVVPQNDPARAELIRALREFHILLRSARLYDRQHPRL